MSSGYQEWIETRFLNAHEQKLKKKAKELSSIVGQLDEVEQKSLSSLGWFSGLLQSFGREKATFLIEERTPREQASGDRKRDQTNLSKLLGGFLEKKKKFVLR